MRVYHGIFLDVLLCIALRGLGYYYLLACDGWWLLLQ